MASNNSRDHTRKRTRLQESTEKRLTDEQFRKKEELKRQKEIFAPSKLVGPRDILVDSNPPKVKAEEDVGRNLSVKQEALEVELLSPDVPNDSFVKCDVPQIKIEADNNSVVKVEETLEIAKCALTEQINDHLVSGEGNKNSVSDIDDDQRVFFSEIEQSDNLSEVTPELDSDKYTQSRIQLLKLLVNQKQDEINTMEKTIKRLQLRLDNPSILDSDNEASNTESEKMNSMQMVSHPLPLEKQHSSSLDYQQIKAQLTADLQEKEAKSSVLSNKIFNLQNEIVAKLNGSSFEKVLPILCNELHLNDILACRKVCCGWQTAVDSFLNYHPSRLPFDKKYELEQVRKLEMGHIPAWSESPLNKLAKAYTFSGLRILDKFTRERKGTIISSTVVLDNISIEGKVSAKILQKFLDTFGVHIRYLTIRHFVDLPNSKIEMLMERVILCLAHVPNLTDLSLAFYVTDELKRKFDSQDSEEEEEFLKIALKECSEISKCFRKNDNLVPKLEKIKSLEIDVKAMGDCMLDLKILVILTRLMSKNRQFRQLNKFCILAKNIVQNQELYAQNLKELTVPVHVLIGEKLQCKELEKCTILMDDYVPFDIPYKIQKMFPTLVYLGFMFEDSGGELKDFTLSQVKCNKKYYTFDRMRSVRTAPPKQPAFKPNSILILELENCNAIPFSSLGCFPNICFIKIINRHIHKVECSNDKTIVNITKLLEGANLYDFKEFWETFSKITVVTARLISDQKTEVNSKSYTWTRDGYKQYLCKTRYNRKRQKRLLK